MDLESGKPVFIEELVQNPTQHANKTVRITGILHAYDPAFDRAEVADGLNLLIVDTQLLGVQKYNVGQIYQLIGVISDVHNDQMAPPINLFKEAQYSLDIVLRARVVWEVDGLDMAIYKKTVLAMRQALEC
ncbi:hypothetical protein COEREDRAFT_88071 [Coemansia reversa NRRL 1564]|uniref:Replication factor A protein 3 n=1 Tax=Coemansia reversa (strain ATCC 12441 / NRRL 1564) TaxID=763665 RepID=A0A2G5B898_COERN|nr:hypothetical protein COEREDRAFT_88071 [Coemansia reversa NRRL 1564]|eukprot:PIA15221.1 hypothetical protein COEREDRAFT_88071 [Coemansia reversa NRRL 1564]